MTETLFVSSCDYDFHSLLKLARGNGHLGQISIVDAQQGYLVVFRDCVPNASNIFKNRLANLAENIWGF